MTPSANLHIIGRSGGDSRPCPVTRCPGTLVDFSLSDGSVRTLCTDHNPSEIEGLA